MTGSNELKTQKRNITTKTKRVKYNILNKQLSTFTLGIYKELNKKIDKYKLRKNK